MGFKEKMAGRMMDDMSPEQKKEMMDEMMGKFFSGMTVEEKSGMMTGMMDRFMAGLSAEEKQKMMGEMMPKMMGGMAGAGEGMPGMMSAMMGLGGASGQGEKPWDMCRRMMGAFSRSGETSAFATPEIRSLFDEWSEQIEGEILEFIRKNRSSDGGQVAAHFKLSRESAEFFMARLARQGKITIKAENKEA